MSGSAAASRPALELDESQKRAAVVGAVLRHQSSHQRAVRLTTTFGQLRSRARQFCAWLLRRPYGGAAVKG